MPDGRMRLDIESPETDNGSEGIPVVADPVLYRIDIAKAMGVSLSTVDRLANHASNPLPLNKTFFRPFILASELHKYLSKNPTILSRYR